jgi:hypothetical protein
MASHIQKMESASLQVVKGLENLMSEVARES